MKKIISTALVCAMIASMGMTAIAADAEAYASSDNTIVDYTKVNIEKTKVEGDDALYIPLYINKSDVKFDATIDTEATPVPEQLRIVEGETNLHKGVINVDDIKDFDNLKLSVKISSGSDYVSSYELEEVDDDVVTDLNGQYAIILNIKEFNGVGSVTIKGTAKISKKTGSTISEYDFNYKIDNSSSENMITVDEDKVTGTNVAGVEVDGDECTIDYDLFEGNVVNFKSGIKYLFLEGEYFSYEVKMSDQGKVALKFNNDVNKSISKLAGSDADLTFFNFVGQPSFDFTGTMTITLPDEDQEYYLYKVNADNKLSEVSAKLNEDGDALTFKTRSLASYVLSDVELDTTATPDEEIEGGTEGGNGGTTTPDKENPTTGSEDFVGVAAAAAVVSVAAAGAVAMRKKED